MTSQDFYNSLRGKTVAFCGLGGSNLPLAKMCAKAGAIVSGRDRRSLEQLGEKGKELQNLGVKLVLGDKYMDNLTESVVFRTPGMSYHQESLEKARKNGQIITSEMEVFLDLCPCKVYGVTGSDGKTTTTSVLAEILEHAGKTVHVGGNIGTPLLPIIDSIRKDDIVVAELSSFQLISMGKSPDVSIVTNMSPNHLDIHKDMKEYINAKKNIILHQTGFGRAVLNLDNKTSFSFAEDVRGQCLLFSRKQKVPFGCWINESGDIYYSENGVDTLVMNQKDIKIPGGYNVENYMAAICACWNDVSPKDIRAVAEEFGGVRHRAQLVRERNGVKWYNDSIATTPSRTVRGMLSLFPQKIIVIAGGYDKKIPFEPMGDPVCEKVKVLVLMGATADLIEKAVKSSSLYHEDCPKILHAKDMEEAVKICDKESVWGDIVAMSPACASFDMYPNYVTRGNVFCDLINSL